jgi:hypothetical protein
MNGSESLGRLPVLLFLLRLGVAVVIIPWSIDKFIRPSHAAVVFERFYLIPGMEAYALQVLGGLQLLIVIGFLLGVARTWTYGAVLAMHTVSTFASWREYLSPYEGSNLLFFAAWPMLAACLMLFMMREEDRFMTV